MWWINLVNWINVHKTVISLRLCIGHLHFEIDSEDRLRAKLYDKRYNFNFLIMNFPLTCSNIPTVSAYGVHISQLILYSRAYGSYHYFIDKEMLLMRKLIIMKQGFLVVKLNPAPWRFYGPHHDLVNRYRIYVFHSRLLICSVYHFHGILSDF